MSETLAAPPENPVVTLDEWTTAARDSAPQWNACIRSVHKPEVKAADDVERGLWYTISTTSQDRDNDVIYPKDSNWNGFLKGGNGPILWAHDYSSFPLGASPKVEVGTRSIKALARFYSNDDLGIPDGAPSLSEMSYRISRRFPGALSTSIGMIPDAENTKFDKDLGSRGGFRFRGAWEGLEFSIVPVPSNRDAIQQMSAGGIDLQPLRAWAAKALDLSGASIVENDKLEALVKAIGVPRGTKIFDLSPSAISESVTAPAGWKASKTMEVDVSVAGAEALQKAVDQFSKVAEGLTERLDAMEEKLAEPATPAEPESPPASFITEAMLLSAVSDGISEAKDQLHLSRTGALPE